MYVCDVGYKKVVKEAYTSYDFPPLIFAVLINVIGREIMKNRYVNIFLC